MRPTDWHEVFGFGDPTPGDPYVVRDVARRWGTVGSEAEYAEGKLRGLLGDDAIVTWIGQAGEQFRTRSSTLPDQLGKVADSYRLASEAMTWWAGRLETHQGDAGRALIDGRAAKLDLDHARARLTGASGDVDLAGRAPALTALAPTPEQVQDAHDRLRAAQQAQSAAQGLVDDAQRRLDLARRLAMDAREARESDARETTRRIHEASEAGIPERSRWQKIKDGAKKVWDAVVTIAKIVVAVLGVVVLIIGGPLAWVVLAAALVLLVDALMKYANGEGSLLDVGLAALGCIPGTKGLTTLAALRGAFRAGGALGAVAHVAAAGKTAVVEMAQSVRALSSLTRTRLMSLTDGALTRIDGQLRAADDLFLGGRFNDQWMSVRTVLHQARGGEFNSAGDLVLHRWTMASDTPGPLTGDDFLSGASRDVGFPANTFRSASYDEVLTVGETSMSRAVTNGSTLNGPFWTHEAPAGGLQAQLDSALLPEWQSQQVPGGWVTNPQATHVVDATLPSGTRYFEGPAGVQVGQVGVLDGGGNQIFLPGVRDNPSWLEPGVRPIQETSR